ncbi:unnamed protein product [marine sediment metagenome]|uniref:Uncharacterized protein n=1 Tax=marine sediment metagenome TaxID=412755 RepID=X1N6S4_9ZZZZ
MPYCLDCGQEITEHQQRNFNGLCPECTRLIKQKERVKQQSKQQVLPMDFKRKYKIICVLWIVFWVLFISYEFYYFQNIIPYTYKDYASDYGLYSSATQIFDAIRLFLGLVLLIILIGYCIESGRKRRILEENNLRN